MEDGRAIRSFIAHLDDDDASVSPSPNIERRCTCSSSPVSSEKDDAAGCYFCQSFEASDLVSGRTILSNDVDDDTPSRGRLKNKAALATMSALKEGTVGRAEKVESRTGGRRQEVGNKRGARHSTLSRCCNYTMTNGTSARINMKRLFTDIQADEPSDVLRVLHAALFSRQCCCIGNGQELEMARVPILYVLPRGWAA